ncbi:MAG: ATP-dependent DNA helicase DinG [Treponema sp.]|jgi:ATP-dependent DNA helicase DinG|nr:ATP-dependent DNA helicase DinG [Treponema sp.]
MQAAKRFTRESVLKLRREIEEAGGNEVFALGRCNGQGLVEELFISARGNKSAVLALRIEDFFDEAGFAGAGDTAAGNDSAVLPDVFIHNHPSGFLTPSDNDLIIAGRAAESGVGAYIVDNQVSSVYVVAEPAGRRRRKALDPEELRAALEEGGAIARRLEGYEKREAQLDLVRLIARAFNEDALAAAEAGTGVGKSFAYLLPAVEFALANKERIVISTATITLQQQLYEKDIPLVLKALGRKIKYVLVKGRGNYLCRRRLGEALLEPPLEDAEYEELRAVTAWAETSRTGSRSELAFLPSAGLWSRVCGEADTCLGARCAERERCFFQALRRESAEAQLLVVNHHLLFADLAARYEGAGYESAVVLPPYTRVIIDEAHAIEDAATSFFSRSWSRLGLSRALSRLYRKRRAREAGLLPRLAAALPPLPGKDPAGPLAEISGLIAAVREAAEKADTAALALCGAEGRYRLVPARGETAGAPLFPSLGELRKAVSALAARIRSLLELADPSSRDGEDPVVWEIRGAVRRLESAQAICGAFLDFSRREDEVLWLERQSGAPDPWAVFSDTPVNIAPLLGEALFKPHKTVVCVSATLCVSPPGREETGAGAFRFWADRSGAALEDSAPEGRRCLTGIFPSPFPYGERTLLAVPEDLPLPDEGPYQDVVNTAIVELAGLAGGSALVLFTSYQSLRSAFEKAAPALERQGIRCLKQGDGDRSRLLADFLADKTSVLFGTDSFWEGVDAPGDTLRMVILCRLPFRVLRDPVFEARRERLEKRGRNSFADLSLPDAVMKFKQGFGRLMRRSSDYGVVAVLDGRVLRKYYGAAFLRALPGTRRSFKEFPGVLRDVERFLYERPPPGTGE